MIYSECMKYVYLDNASITPIDKRVMREIARFSKAEYANPSSIHRAGVAAKKVLGEARRSVATSIGAHADEIFFTGSGTEANNIAIIGTVEAYLKKNPAKKYSDVHIVTSAIEHASILEPVDMLKRKGVRNSHSLLDTRFNSSSALGAARMYSTRVTPIG